MFPPRPPPFFALLSKFPSAPDPMCTVDGPPLKKQRLQPMALTEPYPIYLDYNATTPVCDEAWDAMNGCRYVWGNPSSTHPYGREAKYHVEQARARVAAALGTTDPTEILFTSGGTEANNLAVIGASIARRDASVAAGSPRRNTIVSSVFEHPAVAEVLKFLSLEHGFSIVKLPVVAATGLVSLDAFREALGAADIALVTIMHAQNEIGAVQPIADLVKILHACPRNGRLSPGSGALFHTDAAQSIGKVPVFVPTLGVDLLSVCSHKFYGPKGVGALYIRTGVALHNIQFGAKHERGMRPGTENIILVCGMAAALGVAVRRQPEFAAHALACRKELLSAMLRVLTPKGFIVEVNGSLETALPNTLNVALRHAPSGTYISANRLLADVSNVVAASAGSACHATNPGEEIVVSDALLAVGVGVDRATATLRLSCGSASTLEEMRRAGTVIARKATQQLADW